MECINRTCSREAAPGRASCQRCLVQIAGRVRKIRARRRRAGCCYYCDRKARPGQTYCTHHKLIADRRRLWLKTQGVTRKSDLARETSA